VLLKVNPVEPEEEMLRQAAEVIRRGGLVAFPTETVYGLGADALNPEAVDRIFAAKERPSCDPIIVHIARFEDLCTVARDLPPCAHVLSHHFWPGPLTLIVPRAEMLSARVTAGLDTVAVRMPDHPVALALIQAAETPIAAPSANLFGHVSPTTARHVLDDLGDRADLILDGGPTRIGVESTVLDLSGKEPTILRPGGTNREELSSIIGEIALNVSGRQRGGERSGFASPGLMERHYSPRAELAFFQGAESRTLAAMRARMHECLATGKKVGLLVASEDRDAFAGCPATVGDLGPRDNLCHIAARLFAAMRDLDEGGVEVILARGFGTAGLGLAIQDRLTRAAGGRVEVH
jgi:L-threonylcarbamoyladenylate synthase